MAIFSCAAGVSTDGVPITGPKDVIIWLKRRGDVVMWEKTYANQYCRRVFEQRWE